MIKAVSFDFWFTIVSTNKDLDKKVNEIRKEGLEILFSHYEIPIDSDDIIPKMMQAKKNLIEMKIEQGNIDFSNRHIQIPYLLEFMAPEMPTFLSRSKPILKEQLLNEFEKIVTGALIRVKPPLIPNIDKAFEYVKKMNMKAGIVSNTGLTKGESLKKIMELYHILHYFDSILFSDEVGLMKPNPEIFHTLANNLDLDPSEIIHVGDTIFADIIGARKAGFHEGILFLGGFDDRYQDRYLEEDFKDYAPRYVIDDYRDFPEAIHAVMDEKPSFHKVRRLSIKKRLSL